MTSDRRSRIRQSRDDDVVDDGQLRADAVTRAVRTLPTGGVET
ncbi:hypothetical protein [Streptomyces sp. NPDC047000]